MRLIDWQSRFTALIKARQRDRFEWGRNDCCLFVTDAVLAITGKDIVPESFKGTYSTMLDGFRIIKEYSGGGVEAIAEKLTADNGFVEIQPSFAQRGDVGLYRDPKHGDVLGVSIGARFAFLSQTAGLHYREQREIVRAWSIS